MPSAGGIKESLIDYGLGAGGGLIYAISTAVTGSGFIGSLLGAGLAGSVVKGTRGTVIATMLGFQMILGSLGGGGGSAQSDAGVM